MLKRNNSDLLFANCCGYYLKESTLVACMLPTLSVDNTDAVGVFYQGLYQFILIKLAICLSQGLKCNKDEILSW